VFYKKGVVGGGVGCGENSGVPQTGNDEIVRPQGKIFTNRLQEIKPEIIPDPPVQYLRKYHLTQIDQFSPPLPLILL